MVLGLFVDPAIVTKSTRMAVVLHSNRLRENSVREFLSSMQMHKKLIASQCDGVNPADNADPGDARQAQLPYGNTNFLFRRYRFLYNLIFRNYRRRLR
jgi:hypothetical protein